MLELGQILQDSPEYPDLLRKLGSSGGSKINNLLDSELDFRKVKILLRIQMSNLSVAYLGFGAMIIFSTLSQNFHCWHYIFFGVR